MRRLASPASPERSPSPEMTLAFAVLCVTAAFLIYDGSTRMAISVRSFAKINIGLCIGPLREDGFHELRTLYQTIALHDSVRVDAGRGVGIEIVCKDPRVPCDERNTCYRITERVLRAFKLRSKVRITIEKGLPVEGGVGAASSNAVATMLGLEKALKRQLAPLERLQLAAEVGSDLPLFLVGGTVLGTGRGEQVYPLEDLPGFPCVIATPEIGVSTPAAFAEWDLKHGKLTPSDSSDRMNLFSHSVFEWLCGRGFSPTGVPSKRWGRAEALLLDLVRTGIENDFESVVFPKHPALREVKRALERSGAKYVSLSGSGSAVYGLFADTKIAVNAAKSLTNNGVKSQATTTLPRAQYWKSMLSAKVE
jgi:4-diphosphocytidyl-2-C-methyl-D-erythritol kinase